MNISINHAKYARINVIDFKKRAKPYEPYRVIQGMGELGSD